MKLGLYLAGTYLYDILEDIVISFYFFKSLNQLWETKKVCEDSAIVLKQEIDVVFQENEVVVLAVDNIRRLQVSIS